MGTSYGPGPVHPSAEADMVEGGRGTVTELLEQLEFCRTHHLFIVVA